MVLAIQVETGGTVCTLDEPSTNEAEELGSLGITAGSSVVTVEVSALDVQ